MLEKIPFHKNLVCLEDVSHLNIGFFATKPFSVFDIQVSSHRAEAEQFIKDFSSRDFVEKKECGSLSQSRMQRRRLSCAVKMPRSLSF